MGADHTESPFWAVNPSRLNPQLLFTVCFLARWPFKQNVLFSNVYQNFDLTQYVALTKMLRQLACKKHLKQYYLRNVTEHSTYASSKYAISWQANDVTHPVFFVSDKYKTNDHNRLAMSNLWSFLFQHHACMSAMLAWGQKALCPFKVLSTLKRPNDPIPYGQLSLLVAFNPSNLLIFSYAH